MFGVGSVNWDLTPNQICVLAQRSQAATQFEFLILKCWMEPWWWETSPPSPDPDRQLLDCWWRRPCLMFGSCWFWLTHLTWLTWGVWDDDLTQSELLVNCLQEFCFSHSDFFQRFQTVESFQKQLRGFSPCWHDISLSGFTVNGLGILAGWRKPLKESRRTTFSPLQIYCTVGLPEASLKKKKNPVDYFLPALLARMNICTSRAL